MTGTIKDNWEELNREVEDVCRACRRERDSVTIVGVSKYVDAKKTEELVNAGCKNLGEARPQVLWDKAPALDEAGVRWHMIGHLQRNKVKRTVQYMDVLHSLDSVRLAKAVSEEASSLGREIECFVELNISEEDAKTGMIVRDLSQNLNELLELPAIRLVGFMGMASDEENENRIAEQFLELKSIRDDFQKQYGCDRHPLNSLSMGMSNDFAIAIQCGATHVRIGSRLFPKSDLLSQH